MLGVEGRIFRARRSHLHKSFGGLVQELQQGSARSLTDICRASCEKEDGGVSLDGRLAEAIFPSLALEIQTVLDDEGT